MLPSRLKTRDQGKGLQQTSLSDGKIDPLVAMKQSFQCAKLETMTPKP